MLEQKLLPLSLIAHDDVALPNADKPYPQNLVDLKGLKIGISGRGASTDTATRFMLRQAGLDPDKDVTIMPVGDPGTMLASLKNKVIDAAMAVEPTQTAAIASLKIANTIADIEGGGGPAVFHPYAYNGIFVHTAFLNEHAETARAMVAAVVEACAIVNDPARVADLMDVAANYMKGSDPAVIKTYLEKYRTNYGAVATRQGVDNVSAMLLAWQSIAKAVPTTSSSPRLSCRPKPAHRRAETISSGPPRPTPRSPPTTPGSNTTGGRDRPPALAPLPDRSTSTTW